MVIGFICIFKIFNLYLIDLRETCDFAQKYGLQEKLSCIVSDPFSIIIFFLLKFENYISKRYS